MGPLNSVRLTNNGSGLRSAKSLIAATLLSAGILAHGTANAALTFSFNYVNSGVGFSDFALGTARQTALEQSAALLGAYFTNYNANLTFDVTSEDNAASDTLASAGSGIVSTTSTGFGQTIVQQKITGGGDANGSAADGLITWNFGIPGGWDIDDNVSSGAYDFKSTAMHELLHTFGFSSMIGSDGAGLLSGVTVGSDPDLYGTFDNFLTDGSGNRLIGTDGTFNSSELADLTGGTGSNGVFFSGTNANAANGGNPVNIYSPTTYDDGSSIAHLDDDFFTSQALLMEAATLDGPGTRTLSAIEIGILQDIGYTNINTSPVPVPAAVWLMGSGLLGLLGFGRKSKKAA